MKVIRNRKELSFCIMYNELIFVINCKDLKTFYEMTLYSFNQWEKILKENIK